MSQYDNIAQKYSDPKRENHLQGKHQIYSSWLRHCGQVKGLEVLDLGCGSGRSSRLLAQRGAKVTGLDNSIEMLKIARKIETEDPLGINYIFADAQDYDLGKQFDLITPSFLLHYAQTRKQLESFVSAIKRHLKKQGRLVAININPDNPVLDFDPVIKNTNSVSWVDPPWKNGSQLLVTLYSSQGQARVSFYCWYWSKEVYEEIFAKYGLSGVEWHWPKMDEEGKTLRPNDWQKLEQKTGLAIITARNSE